MSASPAAEEKLTFSRAALKLELLEMEVRLKDYFGGRLSDVEDDIRDLQEANRIRDAALDALASETERRRQALSDSTSRWGIVGNKTTLAIGVIALGSLAATFANVIHTLIG